MKSDDHVTVLSLEGEAVGEGRMPRRGGCWGPGEIKASQRVYAVLLKRIKVEWMTAPFHKQAAGSSKLGGCERMPALTFLMLPAFLLSGLLFLYRPVSGELYSSETIWKQKGCTVCLLPAMSRSPEDYSSSWLLSSSGLYWTQMSRLQRGSLYGGSWDWRVRMARGHNLLLIPVTDLSTRGSWAERDMSIYLSQGSDERFSADGCIL